jgi:hypothetical protein
MMKSSRSQVAIEVFPNQDIFYAAGFGDYKRGYDDALDMLNQA